ncbi:MAG: dCTP deaminase [Dehalococcoidia bacterium]|nr:dCTP deaminase [Dehalococcoidia bacterium]
MILSDRSIAEALASGRLVIAPLGEDALQPASLDIRLDRTFRVFRHHRRAYIDVRESVDDLTAIEEIADNEPFVLHPGEFVLGSTLERVQLGDDIVARVEGKSSLGRLGLLVHATAGYVDPGWDGHLTMELSNVSNLPIRLYYGMKIGQLSFAELTTRADRPYGSPGLRSKYQGQTGPTASRGYQDYRAP